MQIDNSTLTEWQTCLRRGYYKAVLKREPDQPTPALSFGRCVHTGLESWLTHGDLDAACLAARSSWTGPVTDYRSPELAAAVIQEFAKAHPKAPWRFLEVNGKPWIERSYKIEILPGVDWTGRLDGVIQGSSGSWGPLDFKTTSRAGESWWASWDNAQQFLGYAWALSEIIGKRPTSYSVTGFGVRKPTATGTALEYLGTRSWVIQDWQIDEWLTNTRSWIRHIQSITNEDQATMNRSQCIGKYGPCPYKTTCDLNPSYRHNFLASNVFRDATWSPLK